eukprot:jgi/Bigna1/55737/estExt_Genewise1Plus.C_680068
MGPCRWQVLLLVVALKVHASGSLGVTRQRALIHSPVFMDLRLKGNCRPISSTATFNPLRNMRRKNIQLKLRPSATKHWDIEAFSPSKINLFLRIIGKRPDGFHDLGSLFQAISLGDDLKISKLAENVPDEFSCNMPGVPTDDSNLVIRAANLFRERTGVKHGLRICLNKTVPAQGGLGGGSANAATTLWALNKLFDYPVTQADLIDWSGELGSDITFFLSSGTAFCTGRGEILESVPRLPQRSVYVIKPEKGLSTPSVFKSLNYDELSQHDPREILRNFYRDHDIDGQEKYINDLQPPAFPLMPERERNIHIRNWRAKGRRCLPTVYG